jgi:hypothetical protein
MAVLAAKRFPCREARVADAYAGSGNAHRAVYASWLSASPCPVGNELNKLNHCSRRSKRSLRRLDIFRICEGVPLELQLFEGCWIELEITRQREFKWCGFNNLSLLFGDICDNQMTRLILRRLQSGAKRRMVRLDPADKARSTGRRCKLNKIIVPHLLRYTAATLFPQSIRP